MFVCEINLWLGAVWFFFVKEISGEFHQSRFYSFRLEIRDPHVRHIDKRRCFVLPISTQVEKLWERIIRHTLVGNRANKWKTCGVCRPVILSSTIICHETDIRSQKANNKSPDDCLNIISSYQKKSEKNITNTLQKVTLGCDALDWKKKHLACNLGSGSFLTLRTNQNTRTTPCLLATESTLSNASQDLKTDLKPTANVQGLQGRFVVRDYCIGLELFVLHP